MSGVTLLSYMRCQVPAAGSHHKVYFVPVCLQSKLKVLSAKGPSAQNILWPIFGCCLGYYNGLWMTSSFPDDSPQTASDLGQITHSLFDFCICSQCFWFKTKHDLVWASRRSQHPFRRCLFLTSLTPVYCAATLTYCHAVCFHVCRIPPNFWSWGRALWWSRVQCGTTKFPSGVQSKEHTGVRRQWPYPTPPQQLRLPVAS